MPPFIKKPKNFPKTNVKEEKNKPTEEPEEKLAISGQLDKKIKKRQARLDKQKGLVIIRHLPHGFFEDQLKNYFSQFGTVTRLRLARSRRTGGSKGFAFVEFEYPEVAKVAAETMDNYLMFQKVVKADYIPPENQRFNYFKTSVRQVVNKVGKPIYVSSKTAAIQRQTEKVNKWTEEDYQKRVAANMKKLKIFKKKYKDLGIDFDNFIVKPKRHQVPKEETEAEKEKEKDAGESNAEPGSLLLVKKRKKTAPKDEVAIKKSKDARKLGIKDLLEDTLKDDSSSEDEDFIPMAESEEEETSEEESDDASKEDMSSEGESKVDEDESPPQPKRKVKSFEKSSKVDRMAELLKRKPNVGGIHKLSKKTLAGKRQQVKPSAARNVQMLAAVKEIKEQGKMKQLKTADLKKPNAKKGKMQKK